VCKTEYCLLPYCLPNADEETYLRNQRICLLPIICIIKGPYVTNHVETRSLFHPDYPAACTWPIMPLSGRSTVFGRNLISNLQKHMKLKKSFSCENFFIRLQVVGGLWEKLYPQEGGGRHVWRKLFIISVASLVRITAPGLDESYYGYQVTEIYLLNSLQTQRVLPLSQISARLSK
jgi:hypothetical protein